MMTNRSHYSISVFAFLVTLGLFCLSMHEYSYVDVSDIVSNNKEVPAGNKHHVPDDCILCLTTSYGFANTVISEFVFFDNSFEKNVNLPLIIFENHFELSFSERAPPLFFSV